MSGICIGDAVEVKLMGYPAAVRGVIDTVSRGISVSAAAPSTQGLPNVDPMYTWVRLARRRPVRIRITEVPDGVPLVSGMTATITVGIGPRLPPGSRARLGDVGARLMALFDPTPPRPGCVPRLDDDRGAAFSIPTLAKALRPIAEAGGRETVVLVDGCRAATGEECSLSAATLPEGVSAIVAQRRRAGGSGLPVAGLSSLGGEMLPLMQREALSLLGLYQALAARIAGTDTTLGASRSLSRGFSFLPAGFFAGLPEACNQIDPVAGADALRRSAPVDRLRATCAEAAAQWSFSPWFKQRLSAIPEQAAFQKAAAGCNAAAIQAYLANYPDGRYAATVRAIDGACEQDRRRVEAPIAPPPPPEPRSETRSRTIERSADASPPSSPTLADRLTFGIWAAGGYANCGTASKTYQSVRHASSIVWRDGVGNLDVERIIASDVDGLHTQTINSVHPHSKSVTLGTRWSYSSTGENSVQIRSSAGSTFNLVRCR